MRFFLISFAYKFSPSCSIGFRLCKTNVFFDYLNSRNEAILKKLSDSLATTDLN